MLTYVNFKYVAFEYFQSQMDSIDSLFQILIDNSLSESRVFIETIFLSSFLNYSKLSLVPLNVSISIFEI